MTKPRPPNTSNPPTDSADEAVIMEKMKQGLKRLLNTPPETHEEMVRRRRGEGAAPKRKRMEAR